MSLSELFPASEDYLPARDGYCTPPPRAARPVRELRPEPVQPRYAPEGYQEASAPEYRMGDPSAESGEAFHGEPDPLGEIAALIRQLTYGEMIELAGQVWKAAGEDGITGDNLAAVLHHWATRNES
jgi:hypothetical protein